MASCFHAYSYDASVVKSVCQSRGSYANKNLVPHHDKMRKRDLPLARRARQPGGKKCAASLLRLVGYGQISDRKSNLDQGRVKAALPIRLTRPRLTSGLIRARACCRRERVSARLAGLADFAKKFRSRQVPTGSEALSRASKICWSMGSMVRGLAG